MVNLKLGDSREVLRGIFSESIDLTVTSPPYDNLRTYNDSLEWNFDIFKEIAQELFRVTKQGGVVVWVIGDATIKGSETGTSFKQALYFKEIGFNLHDTMIWRKPNAMPQVDRTRYTQSFEYMFILSKAKIKTANLMTIYTKNAGKLLKRGDGNKENINSAGGNIVKSKRIAFNVYDLCVGGSNNGHPATFPEALARDHIISWSNEGDTVLDPFMGSGTTGKMAIQLNRDFIGIEKVKEYYDIAEERIMLEYNQLKI